MNYADEYLVTAFDYAMRFKTRWGTFHTYQTAESTATALADTEAVREALYNLDGATFHGPINFDETYKNASKPMGAIQVQRRRDSGGST